MSLSVELREINSTWQPNTQSSPPSQATLNGRTVVVVDPSYLKKQDVKAGKHRSDTEYIIYLMVIGGWLYASFVATAMVWGATASFTAAAITAGVVVGIPLALLIIYEVATALKERRAANKAV